MKIPWRKIWGGLKKGIQVGAAFDPRLAAIDTLIDKGEEAYPDAPGETKLTFVRDVSDALLTADFSKLDAAQIAAVQAARDEYIAAGVEMRHAVARVDLATRNLKAALAGQPTEAPPADPPVPAPLG